MAWCWTQRLSQKAIEPLLTSSRVTLAGILSETNRVSEGAAPLQKGMAAEAVGHFKRRMELAPDTDGSATMKLAVALTQAGHPLPDKIAYGLWEWGTR